MVDDVESNTRAGLTTDHFPLEVTAPVNVGAGANASGRARAARRDFPAITDEGWRGLHMAVCSINGAVEDAATIEGACGRPQGRYDPSYGGARPSAGEEG